LQYFILWDWLLNTFKDPYAFPQYDASFEFSKLNANELKDISLLDPETIKRKIADREQQQPHQTQLQPQRQADAKVNGKAAAGKPKAKSS
jgi:hypothetical protein